MSASLYFYRQLIKLKPKTVSSINNDVFFIPEEEDEDDGFHDEEEYRDE
jgi:hypothetical protein